MPVKISLLFCLIFANSLSCAQSVLEYNSRKHSTACFTQGLIIKNNTVWESCGGYGKSQLKQWNLETGKLIKRTRFDKKYFAEGLTELNGKLYMLTWQEGVAFEIDPNTLKTIKQHKYAGQGWGLTNNGQQLIMSNGSDALQFINPITFKIESKIHVKINGVSINNLNELEYIDGKIWANVFQTDYIIVIDPKTGSVNKNYYLPNLLNGNKPKPGVLNGIAYDLEHNKIWVTGKNWPLLFEL